MKFYIGSIDETKKKKGWFFGHFMENPALKSDQVEIAWQTISNKKVSPLDCHYHLKSTEINIVLKGSVKITIDNYQYQIKAKSYYVIYPNTVVQSISSGPNTELIVIRYPSIKNDKVTKK